MPATNKAGSRWCPQHRHYHGALHRCVFYDAATLAVVDSEIEAFRDRLRAIGKAPDPMMFQPYEERKHGC